MPKIDFGKLVKDSIPISLVVAATVLVTQWILGFFKFKVTALMSSVPLSTGITAGFGGNVIKFIDGLLPIGLNGDLLWNLILTAVTVMAIYISGIFVYGLLQSWNVPLGKSRIAKIVSVLIIGTIIIHLITAGTAGLKNLLDLSLLVGLLIYTTVVAVVVIWASNQFRLKLAI